jgi:ABC-type phosphate transport system substrate-binding protein
MIRLSRKRDRLGRRGALALAAVLLALAVTAFSAASASALGEQCSGSNVKGLGAFLQTHAQERWGSAGELGFNGSSNPLACSGGQGSGGKPGVSYVPVSSTAALHNWGADDGVLHGKEFRFLGTDIAPAGPVAEPGTMLANMKAALGSDVVVVPVTQTAIAIAAHPPQLPAHPACTVPKITPAQLQKVFSGEIKNWRQIGTASDASIGGDCDQAITRIVRDESAGTTYQFKHFLNQVNPSPLACTGKEKRTWAQLQAPFGPPAEASPNQEWPSNGQCQKGEGSVTTVAGPVAEGEAGPLVFVRENPGTITYGSLPEARQLAPKQVVDVFNGIKYSGPESGEGEANCGAAKYTRPTGWEAGVNVDWSQVYGSDPNIGEASKNAYPICTLSWDVAAANHFTEKAATTVHDYLAFVADKGGGQAAATHIGYRDLPASIAKAATAAIAHINGEEAEEEEEGGEGTGTVLCKSKPELAEGVLTCPKGQEFTGIKVSGSLTGTASFKGVTGESELVVLCPDGKYHGEFNEDGTSAGGGITEIAWGLKEGCTTNLPEEPEAFVSIENTPLDASSFQYLGAEAPQGAFTLAKTEGSPILRIQSSITCIYLPLKASGQVINGTPTQLNLGGEWKLVESTSEACPEVLGSFAPFSLTQTAEGAPLYIAGKVGGEEEGGEEEEGGGGTGTVLCNVEPFLSEGVLACPKGKGFTGEKVTGTLYPGKFGTFESASGPELGVSCPEAHYTGAFNEDGSSAGGIFDFVFGQLEGCSTSFPEEPEAIISFENTPFDASAFKYLGAEGPNGTFSLAKSGGAQPILRIESGERICAYMATFLSFQIFNGSPTLMQMQGKWKLVEEAPKGGCPTALAGAAPLTMTALAEHLPLYIAGK